MPSVTLDHVNIITPDIDETCEFYRSVIGLERRDAPPPLKPDQAQWMYDDQERAVLHINSRDCPRLYERDVPGGLTGPIHHVALRCDDFEATKGRLEARGRDYQVNVFESVGLTQIFTMDPNEVLLELNFYGR